MIFSKFTEESVIVSKETLGHCAIPFPTFFSHARPKSERRVLTGSALAAEDGSACPAQTALSYLPFSAIELVEVVTSEVLITARNLCFCECNHFAFKRGKIEA